jgi:hypothetical protein
MQKWERKWVFFCIFLFYKTAHAMHRGVKCNICGELGTHYATSCPLRNTVGVPLGLRQTQRETKQSDASAAVGHEDPEEPPMLPEELLSLIRKRPEVPYFLRCLACMTLAREAIWCQCCDAFVCRDCLGPSGADGDWACPQCACSSVDNFHVIAAMRACSDAWFQSAAALLDPYSVSSDEEKDRETSNVRKRHRG